MPKSIMTSKGQVTIPKSIREKAHIRTGSALSFHYENGTIIIHPITKDITALKGMVKSKKQKPVTIEEMNQAIKDHAKKVNL